MHLTHGGLNHYDFFVFWCFYIFLKDNNRINDLFFIGFSWNNFWLREELHNWFIFLNSNVALLFFFVWWWQISFWQFKRIFVLALKDKLICSPQIVKLIAQGILNPGLNLWCNYSSCILMAMIRASVNCKQTLLKIWNFELLLSKFWKQIKCVSSFLRNGQ